MADKKITEYNDGSGQSLDYFVGLLNGEFKNLTRANAKKIIYSALTEALSDIGLNATRFLGVNSSNAAGLVSLANAARQIDLTRPITGNVMVVTNAGNYPRFWPGDRAFESSIASIAVGAAIIEHGRTLIVAKDVETKQWATSNVAGGNSYLGREAAIADMNGRSNTDTIIATLGSNAPAATYCRNYYPSNVEANDGNFGAGRWWLPSCGEMAMMWSHVRELNRVLEAIGGTPIPVGSSWGWTSTELSATTAWNLYFYNGYFNNYNKTNETRVRPVSAFY